MAKIDILAPGVLPEKSVATLRERFTCHRAHGGDEVSAILAEVATASAAWPVAGTSTSTARLLDRMPKLEIIANFGVGYDGIDLKCCAERGIVVTNTPDVLTEEVADTALGLLLMTVRELSAAERYLRAGNWSREGNYRLTPATLRDRTVGIAGLGRIGLAIARRLDAMKVPVVYHARNERRGLSYRYYADLRAMAEAVDTLVVVLPGTPQTKGIVDAALLRALGPDGILINIGRGSVVDEDGADRSAHAPASSAPPASTSLSTSRTCRRRCSRSTTSSFSRTSAPPRSSPGTPWASSWSTT